jgi:dsDNA-specific endonuclease/ATPase MutS2
MSGSPIDPPDLLGWKTIASALYGLLTLLGVGVVRWLLQRFQKQLDDHSTRISKLEGSYVTQEQLDKHLDKLEAVSFRMHAENKNSLERIEEKVANASNTRHDIRDSSHTMLTMLRELVEHARRQ